ncbi:MAG: chorismate-binding protein [Ignavibacteriaceae bacterium]|nr:chorismate-binding protein [Ignavibacteriaceae bacterium]
MEKILIQKRGTAEHNLPRALCLVKSPVQYVRNIPVFTSQVIVPRIAARITPERIEVILMNRKTKKELDYFRTKVKEFLASLLKASSSPETEAPAAALRKTIEAQNGFDDWEKKFNASVELIVSGDVEKIVLSRHRKYQLVSKLDQNLMWQKLNTLKNTSYKYLIEEKSNLHFAATPERLFTLNGNIVETEALAGTFKKGKPDPDRNKNLYEHYLVRDHLVDKLSRAGGNCVFPPEPLNKSYSDYNHYYTPVKAVFRRPPGFISILKKIFPTPATTGYPVRKVVSKIPEIEKYDREYYTGAVGLIYSNNQAEFAVNLRCGKADKDEVTLYAGCGLVCGSDARKEFGESEMKMKSMASLFKI